MDTSITLENFSLYTKARKGWQIDNWCLHDKNLDTNRRTLTSCTKKVVLYLTLDQHCHVHEHVVQLLDGRLQLDDVRVPRLDVCQRLLCCSCVHDDTLRAGQASKKRMKGKNEWSNSCIVYMYLIQPEGQKYLCNCKIDPFSLFLQSDSFNNTLYI